MVKLVHEFTVPETLCGGDAAAPRKVGMLPLTAEQELQASKSGRFDVMRTQYAAVRMSIVELDGKSANYADGDVDRFWEKTDPRVRSLLLQAYNRISSPSSEEEESFFKSEVVKA